MRTSFSVLYFSLLCLQASATRVGFQRRLTARAVEFKPLQSLSSGSGADGDNNVDTIFDVQYTANITLNGKSVHVVLDTENPDLWVLPSSDIGTFNDTKIPATITFADDVNKVEGTIGVSKFEFGQHTVERQAFLYAQQSTLDQFPKLGVHGSFGLGFSLEKVSPINQAIQKQFGANATWGQTVLTNIFQAFPARPNFIGFDLARGQNNNHQGSFTIGEYDPDYRQISSAPKLVQFPQNAGRWSTLVDRITVNGKNLDLTSVNRETPSGKTIVLFSTTSAKNVFPKAVGDQIYSAVEGAEKYESGGKGIWIVPCDATPDVRFEFAGQSYSIHPLDLTSVEVDVLPTGRNYTTCVATYLEDDDRGDGAYDIVLGNTFLRNVYSVFDFGDERGGFITEPYIQLQSKTDYTRAVDEFKRIRPEELRNLEPPLDPSDLVRVLKDNEGNPGPSSDSSSNLDSANDTSEGSQVAKYAPAVIGLLAANLALLLAVLGFAILSYVRRGGSQKGGARALRASQPHYTKIREEEGYELPSFKNPYDS